MVLAGGVQADEIWGYVGMKEKTRAVNRDEAHGDAYCFTALPRFNDYQKMKWKFMNKKRVLFLHSGFFLLDFTLTIRCIAHHPSSDNHNFST